MIVESMRELVLKPTAEFPHGGTLLQIQLSYSLLFCSGIGTLEIYRYKDSRWGQDGRKPQFVWKWRKGHKFWCMEDALTK